MNSFWKGWDHQKAIRVTNKTFLAGIAMLLLGIPIGAMEDSEVWMYAISGPGLLLAVWSYILNLRKAVCPHCGAFLGDLPRMAEKSHSYCSHCGEKL